jgi:hypothetical protein
MNTRNAFRIAAIVLVVVTAAVAGRKAPPVTLGELDKDAKHGRDYPPVVIAEFNLQRATDTSLTDEERLESMRVVRAVNAPVTSDTDVLRQMLVNPETPDALKSEVMAYLETSGSTTSSRFVASALTNPNVSADTREELLAWASSTGGSDMYAEVVKIWATQPVGGDNEQVFEDLVEELSQNESWSAALVESLGTKGFMAKGSALEVLATRLSHDQFAAEIRAARPAHISIATLQTFLSTFDYIPQTRDELVRAVSLFKDERESFDQVAALYRKWNRADGYTFQITDYPLLKELVRNPGAVDTSRVRLMADLTSKMKDLRHQPHYTGGDSSANYNNRLYELKDDLTMADLWRISLLMDLLNRPSVRAGLEYLADRDEADTTTAWGGLLFYEGGNIEARRYPPLKEGADNDLAFRPTERMLSDADGAIGRFVCHFDDTDNANRVGPTRAELASAAVNGYAGMTITRLDEDNFTAHYFTPDGDIVSLGTYTFQVR